MNVTLYFLRRRNSSAYTAPISPSRLLCAREYLLHRVEKHHLGAVGADDSFQQANTLGRGQDDAC